MKRVLKIFFLLFAFALPVCFVAQNNDEEYSTAKRQYDAGEYNVAAQIFQKLATQGNVKAIYRLGRCYEEGRGVGKNEAEAVKLYIQAADHGHAKAQYRAARAYEKGMSVSADAKKAFSFYRSSAEQGNAKAQYQLAKCYKKGIGTKKDVDKAFNYYKQSAEQDYAKAQLALGKCYMEGHGVKKDIPIAKKWLHKAVNNSDGGHQLLKDIKKDAKNGDRDSQEVLELLAEN